MDIDVSVTDKDVAQWFGDLYIINRRQAKAIEALDQKITELQNRLMPIESQSPRG